MPAKNPNEEARTQKARLMVYRAFELCGLGSDGSAICPVCQKADKGKSKVSLYGDQGRYWCHRHGGGGNAIDVVQHMLYPGNFRAARAFLLGEPIPDGTKEVARPKPVIIDVQPDFEAVQDFDVYDFVAAFGTQPDGTNPNMDAACTFFGQWHIDEGAVREAGFTYITACARCGSDGHVPHDIAALHKALYATFGRERLIACGMLSEWSKDGKSGLSFLLNETYPIVEPHLTTSGRVAWLQFRGSPATAAKYAAHKRYESYVKRLKANPATAGAPVPKVKYMTKFLSIKGAARHTQIGMGLPRLYALKTAGVRAVVVIVEGGKDGAAGAALGRIPLPGKAPFEVLSIAGKSAMPDARVCQMLEFHDVLIALDGDDAGAEGREKLLAHLLRHGVPARVIPRSRLDGSLVDVPGDLAGATLSELREVVEAHLPGRGVFGISPSAAAQLKAEAGNVALSELTLAALRDLTGPVAQATVASIESTLGELAALSTAFLPVIDGWDVADQLVARKASEGCDCTTCASWRVTHP